eukprot:g2068.t1
MLHVLADGGFRPARTKVAEHLKPTAGGAGLLLPSYRGDSFTWDYELPPKVFPCLQSHRARLAKTLWEAQGGALRAAFEAAHREGRSSFLPLGVSDAMLTHYSGDGSGYRPHVDSSVYDVGGFVVTCVYYLSDGGPQKASGGRLRVQLLDTGETCDVPPAADRLMKKDTQ